MVSIVIPVYNVENYIEETINSCLKQSFKNFEIIVVDDGSTDRTKIKIEKYLKLKNFYYYYQENSGQSVARNRGIDKAKGEYIALLDADDVCLKNRLEEQVRVLEQNKEIDFIFNDVYLIDENSKVIDKYEMEIVFEKQEDFYAYMMFRQIIPCLPSMMIRRKCFDKLKYSENYRFAEDYKLILEMIKRYKGYYINKPLYLYRKHNKNLTNGIEAQLKGENQVIKEIGIEDIKIAIEKTNFTFDEKKILLGKILIKIDMFKDALESLESVKEKNEVVFFYIGNIYQELKEYKKAKQAYKKGLLIKVLPELYNNLAVAYGKENRVEKAKEYFTKAIKINENYMDASYNLKSNKLKFKLTKRELRKTLMRYR